MKRKPAAKKDEGAAKKAPAQEEAAKKAPAQDEDAKKVPAQQEGQVEDSPAPKAEGAAKEGDRG